MNVETPGSREDVHRRGSLRTRFREWRGERPFWAGLFTLLGGVPIVYFPYADVRLGNVTVAMSTTAGAGSLVIGVLLLTLGPALWFQKSIRSLAGVAAILLALVSLPVANIGGFLIGFLFAMLGGAMALSWSPPETPEAEPEAVAEAESKSRSEPAADTGSPDPAPAPDAETDAQYAYYADPDTAVSLPAPGGVELPGPAVEAVPQYGHYADAGVMASGGGDLSGLGTGTDPQYGYYPDAALLASGSGQPPAPGTGTDPQYGYYPDAAAMAPGNGVLPVPGVEAAPQYGYGYYPDAGVAAPGNGAQPGPGTEMDAQYRYYAHMQGDPLQWPDVPGTTAHTNGGGNSAW